MSLSTDYTIYPLLPFPIIPIPIIPIITLYHSLCYSLLFRLFRIIPIISLILAIPIRLSEKNVVKHAEPPVKPPGKARRVKTECPGPRGGGRGEKSAYKRGLLCDTKTMKTYQINTGI